MSKITIDCRFASKPVGLGTYTRNLVTNLLPLLAEHDVTLLVRKTSESWLDSLTCDADLCTANFGHYTLQEQTALPGLLKKTEADLFFSPHFNVPLACGRPFVVTIHDLILHRYPNQASLLKQIAYKVLMRHSVQSSCGIIAVSKFTASEIASVYGKSAAEKTTVIGEGVDAAFTQRQPQDVLGYYELPSDYFLYIGNAKQHKNVQMLLDAFVASGTQQPLVLVTSGPEVSKLTLPPHVYKISDVPSEHMPSLYAKSSCFVTPSLYEGFCLPVLEAMAAKRPVIATNITAIPEITGPNARLVEPTLSSLADALAHPPTVADPVPADMTWKTAAEKTATVLLSHLHG